MPAGALGGCNGRNGQSVVHLAPRPPAPLPVGAAERPGAAVRSAPGPWSAGGEQRHVARPRRRSSNIILPSPNADRSGRVVLGPGGACLCDNGMGWFRMVGGGGLWPWAGRRGAGGTSSARQQKRRWGWEHGTNEKERTRRRRPTDAGSDQQVVIRSTLQSDHIWPGVRTKTMEQLGSDCGAFGLCRQDGMGFLIPNLEIHRRR